MAYVLHLPASELPESIAIDSQGSMYLSLASAAKVIKVSRSGSQSTYASFAGGSTPLGVRFDASGNLYVAVVSGPGLDGSGVWRIPRGGGSPVEVAAIPGFLNGLAFDHRGNLYVSESAGGVIYRISSRGAVRTWSRSRLLAPITGNGPCGLPHPASPPLGVNGLAFNRNGDLLAANTTVGTIVRIPVKQDGGPGRASRLAGPECRLWGADGIAMDTHDNVYVAANAIRDIVRISPHGSLRVLASFAGGDPLYTPSDIAFGTGRATREHIFITNAAFFTAGTGAGVVTADVGIPGRPLP